MSNMNIRKWVGLWFFSLVIACGLTGCETGAVYQEPDPEAATREDTLRIGDTVKIDFSNLSERQISPHEEQIKGDGSITLPLVGTFQAAGKTTGELQKEIQKAYSKYYVSMNVTVKAPERYYSVGGEVRSPKRDVYVGGTTVIKAIQSAGDFTEFARRNKVILTRANGKTLTVDCDKALRNPRLDLPVYPGDTIHVPRRYF